MDNNKMGGTLDKDGYILYSGGRDELNKKLRERDDEIDRLRLLIAEKDATIKSLAELLSMRDVDDTQ